MLAVRKRQIDKDPLIPMVSSCLLRKVFYSANVYTNEKIGGRVSTRTNDALTNLSSSKPTILIVIVVLSAFPYYLLTLVSDGYAKE